MAAAAAAIPVVDFSSLSLSITDDKLKDGGDEFQRTADQIVDAFTDIGFVYLRNTGFPHQLVGIRGPVHC